MMISHQMFLNSILDAEYKEDVKAKLKRRKKKKQRAKEDQL